MTPGNRRVRAVVPIPAGAILKDEGADARNVPLSLGTEVVFLLRTVKGVEVGDGNRVAG